MSRKVSFLVIVLCALTIGVRSQTLLDRFEQLTEAEQEIIRNLWVSFKVTHQRIFVDTFEENNRFLTFVETYMFIKEFQAKHPRASLALNKFADWTADELKKLRGFDPSADDFSGLTSEFFYHSDTPLSDLPTYVNWVEKGYVNPVQDQGHCGSCYAFSACGAMEGQYYKATGKSVILSEQNILDCGQGYYKASHRDEPDCSAGGSPARSFMYVKHNMGIDSFQSYPYVSGHYMASDEDRQCKYSPAFSQGYVTGFKFVGTPFKPSDETNLQRAVAEIGPISVSIDANHISFMQWNGTGVYQDPDCSSTQLDHAVLLVGYGTTTEGEDYWLIKNSWGTNWGDNGYVKMARNAGNMCGIGTYAVYPETFVPAA